MTLGRTSQPARSRPVPVAPGQAFLLLARARAVLGEAACADTDDERFRLAHLGALRVAAAVLAERGRPAGSRRRLLSAGVVIESVAPELGDWAANIAAGAAARAAIEAGANHVVGSREADDQLRAACEFLHVVETSLSLLAPPLAS
jgi:hypothetical protein